MHYARWPLLLLHCTAICAASVVNYPIIRQDGTIDFPPQQNGDPNGSQSGNQNSDQNGGQNSDQNGGLNGDQNGDQNGGQNVDQYETTTSSSSSSSSSRVTLFSGNTTLITTTSSTSSSTSTVITTTSTTSSYSTEETSTSTTPPSTSTTPTSTKVSTTSTTPSSTKASPTPTTPSSTRAPSTTKPAPSSTAELNRIPDNTTSIEISSSTVQLNTSTEISSSTVQANTTTILPLTTSVANSTTSKATLTTSHITNTTISSATSSSSAALRCGKDSGSFVSPPAKSMKMSSIKTCKSACKADSKCKSFEFGTIDGNGNSCWFFNEPVSKLDIGDAHEGFTWNFYDSDCEPSTRCGQEGKFVTDPSKKMKVDSVKKCKEACMADSNCQAFESGTTDKSGDNCWLFDTAVWDLEVGAPAPGFTWTFYDRDCSV